MKLKIDTVQTKVYGDDAIKMTSKLELTPEEQVVFDAHSEAQGMIIAAGLCLHDKKHSIFYARSIVNGSTDVFKTEANRAEFEKSLRAGCAELKEVLHRLATTQKSYESDI